MAFVFFKFVCLIRYISYPRILLYLNDCKNFDASTFAKAYMVPQRTHKVKTDAT